MFILAGLRIYLFFHFIANGSSVKPVVGLLLSVRPLLLVRNALCRSSVPIPSITAVQAATMRLAPLRPRCNVPLLVMLPLPCALLGHLCHRPRAACCRMPPHGTSSLIPLHNLQHLDARARLWALM